MINSIEPAKDPLQDPKASVLASKFPTLFSGKLGCFKDVFVKLDIDETIKPSRQQQRPIPFHLRDQVEEKLHEQIRMGILEPINKNSGPTPWISNLVLASKDKTVKLNQKRTGRELLRGPSMKLNQPVPTTDIRITCDSRDANKAIRRVRFPSKTVDDLIYMVNGACEFSVLDIKDAFHQLMLAEESRNITAITTHIGLLRYKRLHMGISCASEIH